MRAAGHPGDGWRGVPEEYPTRRRLDAACAAQVRGYVRQLALDCAGLDTLPRPTLHRLLTAAAVQAELHACRELSFSQVSPALASLLGDLLLERRDIEPLRGAELDAGGVASLQPRLRLEDSTPPRNASACGDRTRDGDALRLVRDRLDPNGEQATLDHVKPESLGGS